MYYLNNLENNAALSAPSNPATIMTHLASSVLCGQVSRVQEPMDHKMSIVQHEKVCSDQTRVKQASYGKEDIDDLCMLYGAAVGHRLATVHVAETLKMRSHTKRTSWKNKLRTHQWKGNSERACSRKEERTQYRKKMEREHILSIPPWDVRISHNLLEK